MPQSWRRSLGTHETVSVVIGSRLQSVAQASHCHDMTWVCCISLDLGAQAPDVHIDEATVAEVVVAPHLVEQGLAAEHTTRVLTEFDQESELGLGQVQFDTRTKHLALVGNDLEIAEDELGVTGAHRTDATQQSADAGGQLFRCEWLGEVVVSSGFESCDDVVRVGASLLLKERQVIYDTTIIANDVVYPV